MRMRSRGILHMALGHESRARKLTPHPGPGAGGPRSPVLSPPPLKFKKLLVRDPGPDKFIIYLLRNSSPWPDFPDFLIHSWSVRIVPHSDK